MFTMPKLPYALDNLAPFITSTQLDLHYNKHQQAYLDKLNTLVKKSQFRTSSLDDIIKYSNDELLINAEQFWNHSFYWNSMKHPGISLPVNPMFSQRILSDFGTPYLMAQDFLLRANNFFGSGWIWLVYNQSNKSIYWETTQNADNPLRNSLTPLLCCDLWEHAYYWDYQNRRKDYLEGWINHLVNWNFASSNFEAIMSSWKLGS